MERQEALRHLELAREAHAGLAGPCAGEWLERLDAEYGRLEAAVGWLAGWGEAQAALELAGLLLRYWEMSGIRGEGRAVVGVALSAAGAEERTPARASALHADGLLAFRQGLNDEARVRFDESASIAREHGDAGAELLAVVGLARVALRDGDTAAVRSRSDEGRALARALGDRAAEAGPLHMRAAAATIDGAYDEARELFRSSLALNRELDRPAMVGAELYNLACVELERGDVAEARGLLAEAVGVARALGHVALLRYCVLGLGLLAAADGDDRRAAELLAAAEDAFAASGSELDPDDRRKLDGARARLRERLGDGALAAASERGRSLSHDEALAGVLAPAPSW